VDKCKQLAKPLEKGNKNMKNREHNILLYTKNNIVHSIIKERRKLIFKFISVINQPDAYIFCFTISLFPGSACFEHMYSSHP